MTSHSLHGFALICNTISRNTSFFCEPVQLDRGESTPHMEPEDSSGEYKQACLASSSPATPSLKMKSIDLSYLKHIKAANTHISNIKSTSINKGTFALISSPVSHLHCTCYFAISLKFFQVVKDFFMQLGQKCSTVTLCSHVSVSRLLVMGSGSVPTH